MFRRTCKIIAQAASGETLDMSALRCRFEVKMHSHLGPDKATIKITNQNPDIARRFVTPNAEFTNISIYAGYEDDITGLIFSGGIVQAFYGRENPTDTLTTIIATAAHQAHNYATVNKTFAAGSTPRDHVNAAIQAMSKYGVSLGYVGQSVNLSTPKYPRAVTLFGMARKVLYDVGRLYNAGVSYRNYKVTILGPTDYVPGGIVKLNSQTGMIGMPTQEIGGVMVRSLINTRIKVGHRIQINQRDIQPLALQPQPNGDAAIYNPQLGQIAMDGIYTVFRIDVTGDTRGTPWWFDIAALPVGQAPTSMSIDSGLNAQGSAL
jgi:hypothetical protein